MHGQSTATEPDAYVAGVDDDRRPQIAALDARIVAAAPTLRRYVDHGMLAYGRYEYRYASGREGDWFLVGVASNKAYISLYVSTVDLEPYLGRLPKANLGRACIRFKRIDDVDLEVIDEIVRAAAQNDGKRIVA